MSREGRAQGLAKEFSAVADKHPGADNPLLALRNWWSDLYQVLSVTRYSLFILLIGGLSFLIIPQGQDVLRRMAEWEGGMMEKGLPEILEIVGRWILFFSAVLVWALSSWYWARVILYLSKPKHPPELGSPPDVDRQDRFRVFVPRAYGFLALLAMSVALWMAARNYRVFQDDDPVVRLRVAAVICFGLALGFLGFVVKRRDLISAIRSRRRGLTVAQREPYAPTAQFETIAALPAGTRTAALISLGVSLVLGLLFTFWPVPVGATLGTVPIVLLTAANWVLFGTGLLYLSRRARFPLLLLLLLLAVLFSRCNDNHSIRLAETADVRTGSSIEAHFKKWQANIPPGDPIFIVAAEGGGIRAAYWAAIVLGHLEDAYPNLPGSPGFSRHVFAISGVSGGSLGAAVFNALVAEEALPARDKPLRCGTLQDCAGKVLEADFLSPTLARMVAPDLGQRFLFFPIPYVDRARALEDSWAAGWKDAVGNDRFNQPFLSLWDGGAATTLPSLVFNGTHVETGRRIVTTNLKWRSGELVDAYDVFRTLGSDLQLKTAVHNSARFTYISPAGTMRPRKREGLGKARGHVVDGGYFENSGTASALDLLTAVRKACDNGCKNRIYILYLRNNPATDPDTMPNPAHPEEGEGEESGQPDKDLEPFADSYPRLNELLSPPRALVNASNARGSLAVDSLRAAVAPAKPGTGTMAAPAESRPSRFFFEFGLCERIDGERVPLPLGWQLSESAQEAMNHQLANGCPGSNNPGIVTEIGRILKRLPLGRGTL